MNSKEQKPQKEFIGVVKTCGMNKSIVVDIVTLKPDRFYDKYVKHTKRVMAHDEENSAKVGDRVRVVETRPLSKRKRWRLTNILDRAKTLEADEASSI